MSADLLFARLQMAWSLGFHIIFAVVGIALPALMAIAEWRYLRTGDPAWLDLAKRWAKGTAILFAVGAVSGTVLSFELGLLWPRFMHLAGPFIGLPFTLEAFAFFLEAIFLGVYLYGWDRIPDRLHLFSAVVIAIAGAASGAFVVLVNAWMNTPVGFRFEDGALLDADPLAALFAPAAFHQVAHMTVAAYTATGFAVAGIHAYFLRRGTHRDLHRKAFTLALGMAVVAAPLSVVTGHFSGEEVARLQPAKLAAMEAHYETAACAPLRIGGIPDDDAMELRYGLELPCGLSLLAHRDPSAEVTGLDAYPREDWPPVAITHAAFDLMVGIGLLLLALAGWATWRWMRDRAVPTGRRLLGAFVLAAPLGMIAVEAGWVVTEVGRQPWIIYGFVRTEDAVTPMPGILWTFLSVVAVYLLLAAITVYLLRRQFLSASDRDENAPGEGPP